MRKFISATLAAVMTASVFATASVAAPVAPMAPATAKSDNNLIQVRDWRNGGNWRRDGNFRHRDFDGPRRFSNHRDGYYNGYYGSRHRHDGWRERNGWFYPGAAFLGGVIVGDLINRSDDIDDGYVAPRHARLTRAHVEWCYDRYKSYRSRDNSFQPYNGPRQQCYSPYS